MTAPRFVACICGHPKQRHDVDGFAPQCVAEHCDCLQYRPATAVAAKPTQSVAQLADHRPAEVAAPGVQASDIAALLEQGKKSTSKRIANLAARIDADLQVLIERLNEERQQAAARAEIDRLEQQLAAARAKLTGAKTTPPRKAGRTAAPRADCGGEYANLGVHRYKAHGIKAGA